jgi:hypothetical protein
MFRTSLFDGRPVQPVQRDDRAAQNAVAACAPGLLNMHPMSDIGIANVWPAPSARAFYELV